MTTNVLVTGAFGRCGTALIDHLHDHDDFSFTYLDRDDPPETYVDGTLETELNTVRADVTDLDALRPIFENQDAVVHLAADPRVEAPWPSVLENNIVGTYNILEAAREAEIESIVFASTLHVVGMYETEHRPAIYDPDYDLELDHTAPVRPDSHYGASKSFGEDLGRYYVENYQFPSRFYVLRICSVRHSEYDHPYGDAERGVDTGQFDRESDAYAEQVARLKATWLSRRDFAQEVRQCLLDETVSFDIFAGVSDNDARWFDIEHARETIGYEPRDNGAEWDAPPS